ARLNDLDNRFNGFRNQFETAANRMIEKTVETVYPNFVVAANPRLKPGVNEKLVFTHPLKVGENERLSLHTISNDQWE
ncbi:MAG TPA: hypothetical protein VF074_17865, partial [Pyrinomonadaceae bacterium]